MHAFLIIGEDPHSKIEKLVSSQKARALPFELLKISDSRELARQASLSFSERVAFVIKNIDNASTEAQNAFLKTLEEPQENVLFILTASDPNSVLETIKSRAHLVQSENVTLELDKSGRSLEFLQKPTTEKFSEVGEIRTREDAIAFVKGLAGVAHSDPAKYGEQLEIYDDTLTNLHSNGNVVLQLTSMIVRLDGAAHML